ncbi:uncharacterized protein BROUX77_001625 [Berkeleyomyces rouxiae]|uniref:uncharacterized protein n=1 Tax=Berkeleyomyces rouxiae TaxID=2035830 RepID=UPI003B774071
MPLSTLASHIGLDMVDMDMDMDAVDSMLFGNLPEMLAQDLELSSDVFVSKNMTAGHPQSSLSLESRQAAAEAWEDDAEDDAMVPPPIALPLASSSLYEVMLRVKSLGSISEASSVQESIAMLRSMNTPDSLRDDCAATSTFAPLPAHMPVTVSAVTQRDDGSITESVYSSSSLDISMEPPIIRLSQSNDTSMGFNHYTLSPSISHIATDNTPKSIPLRWSVFGTESAISIVSQKSDPDTSWIDDSDNDEQDSTPKGGQQPKLSMPQCPLPEKRHLLASHSHALASPPATPPRANSPELHLLYEPFINCESIPQTPISPPLHPRTSHLPPSRDTLPLQRAQSMHSSKYQQTNSEHVATISRPSSRPSCNPSRLRDSAFTAPRQASSTMSIDFDDSRFYSHIQEQHRPFSQSADEYERHLISPTSARNLTDAMYLEDDDDDADCQNKPSLLQKRISSNPQLRSFLSTPQEPSRLNTPDSWVHPSYTFEASQLPLPSAPVQAWIENPTENYVASTEERRVGLPLPPDVADTLRVNIACFPDTMLSTSSLTIETIRSYSRKLKHGPLVSRSKIISQPALTHHGRKWRLSRALGSLRSGNSSRSGPSPLHEIPPVGGSTMSQSGNPWMALRSVFPGASDYLCDALYAHVLAYNYISSLCCRHIPTPLASPSHSTPSSAHSNISFRLQSSGFSHSRQHSFSDGPSDIPKKAAHLLGLDAPLSDIRCNSPVPSSGSGSNKKKSKIGSQAIGSNPFTLPTSLGSQNQGLDQAMSELQVGLSKCIARLVVTMRGNVQDAGYSDLVEETMEVDPLLLRSLNEIVRRCEES